jgi:hypothetical protein
LFRNLYSDDGKLKDIKTPEPTYISDDADGKDQGLKARRSRGIFHFEKRKKKEK